MKVVYIISDIDKAVYFETTALRLRDARIQVSFILINSHKGRLDHFLNSHGFTVHQLSCQKISRSLKAIWLCRRLLKEVKPDVVHCHLALANWIGLWGATLSGVRHRVYTRHSGAPLHLGWKERLIDRIQNKLTTKIVAISIVIYELLRRQGVRNEKIILIHHGFDLDRFGSVSDEEKNELKKNYNPEGSYPVIGVIARWMEWKGVQYTIEAFRQLLHQYPHAQLMLFGGGNGADYEQSILSDIKSIPEQNIRVVPFEANVFALYSLFDVYVHVPVNPSCEAFGQTYVEALAAGCPAIFTLSGIAREFIVDRENAVVVPFCDSAAIYTSIETIINDNLISKQLVQRGYSSVSELFTFDKHIQSLFLLYHEKYV